MNVLLYAIFSCVAAGNTDYCRPLGMPFVFQSVDQCIEVMTTKLGSGDLLDGRLYLGSSPVWYECKQRPTSQWSQIK
jgi:hypothetical protein